MFENELNGETNLSDVGEDDLEVIIGRRNSNVKVSECKTILAPSLCKCI